MIIGITGSRYGITRQQLDFVKNNLKPMNIEEIHHGSCQGVDESVHNELVGGHAKVIIHPPIKPFYRFYPKPHENITMLPEKEYLERNRDIVEACKVLFAFPKEYKVQHRGGTWTTMKYAEKAGKMIYCIYPNGTVEQFNCLKPLYKPNSSVV